MSPPPGNLSAFLRRLSEADTRGHRVVLTLAPGGEVFETSAADVKDLLGLWGPLRPTTGVRIKGPSFEERLRRYLKPQGK